MELLQPLDLVSVKKKSELSEPISLIEFKNALLPYEALLQKAPIGIAVSGGPDSMALAYLLKEVEHRFSFPLTALIVDHALRETSNVEAQQTVLRLHEMGLRTELLIWKHETVQSRIHQRARKARYALLTEACQRLGIKTLVMAHHLDDQAETVLLRITKGSGIEGLSAMAPLRSEGDLMIIRPLLTFAKSRLVATCKASHIPYVNDPSNLSNLFARGRLRKVWPLLEEEGVTTENLVAIAEGAREANEALSYYAQQLGDKAISLSAYGVLTINRAQISEAPRAIQRRLMRLSLEKIHRRDYPPSKESLTRLLDLLRSPSYVGRVTLNGSLIKFYPDQITFIREPGAITSSEIGVGETVIYDQRWQVTVSSTAPLTQYRLAPLGHPPHDFIDKLSPQLRKKVPQGQVRASLPALWNETTLLTIPSFESPDSTSYAHAKLLTNLL